MVVVSSNHRDRLSYLVEGVERRVTALWTSSSVSRPEVCLQIKEKRQSRTWVWGAFTGVCLLIAIFSSASPGIVTREDHISLCWASLRSLASFSYQTVCLVTVQLREMIIFLSRTETQFCTALLFRTDCGLWLKVKYVMPICVLLLCPLPQKEHISCLLTRWKLSIAMKTT